MSTQQRVLNPTAEQRRNASKPFTTRWRGLVRDNMNEGYNAETAAAMVEDSHPGLRDKMLREANPRRR